MKPGGFRQVPPPPLPWGSFKSETGVLQTSATHPLPGRSSESETNKASASKSIIFNKFPQSVSADKVSSISLVFGGLASCVCRAYQRGNVKIARCRQSRRSTTDCILWELRTSSLSFCSRAQIALPPTNDNLGVHCGQRNVLTRFAQTRVHQAAVDLTY